MLFVGRKTIPLSVKGQMRKVQRRRSARNEKNAYTMGREKKIDCI